MMDNMYMYSAVTGSTRTECLAMLGKSMQKQSF